MKEKYITINDKSEYGKITFVTEIKEIIDILSSNENYKFYFLCTEEFEQGLVQLERIEKSNDNHSEWKDEYYDKYEWDEPINDIDSDEESFDHTNEVHSKFETINSIYQRPGGINVEMIELHTINDIGFRESFLKKITELVKNNKYCELDDNLFALTGSIQESRDAIICNYDTKMIKEYITEPYGYIVKWFRWGWKEGENFYFGYIKQ